MGANHSSTRRSLEARIITRLNMRSGPSFSTGLRGQIQFRQFNPARDPGRHVPDLFLYVKAAAPHRRMLGRIDVDTSQGLLTIALRPKFWASCAVLLLKGPSRPALLVGLVRDT